jgi:hypothetical protein
MSKLLPPIPPILSKAVEKIGQPSNLKKALTTGWLSLP